MSTNVMVERDQIVNDLRGAIRDGNSGLRYVPRLLERVIDTDAWRERYDAKTRETVTFDRFDDFVAAAPTAGLGASRELIDQIVGTKKENAEVRRKVRKVRKIGQGTRTDLSPLPLDSNRSDTGEGSGYTADRLARDAPEQYAAVKAGQKTINAAAVSAGIRPHRISVRLDRPESIAASLRKYLTEEQRATLAALLLDG